MHSWDVLGRFFHGLAFFTLSLTAVFLQRRSRRIPLTRRLHWLGLFAICETLVAWADLFALLTPDAIVLPAIVRPAVLAFGYVCLLVLGILGGSPDETSRTDVARWLIGLTLLWAVPYLCALLLMPAQRETVVRSTEALVHYLLGFPGGLLAAIGLRRQSRKTLDLAMRSRRRPLQLVEVAMGAFGVLHLILPPHAPFLPASNFNAQVFPPVVVEGLWAIVGIGLTIGINYALNSAQREIEQWIEGIERLQALAADRERIGRDLHDGIIQSIYAAGLLLESVQPIIPSDPMRAQAQLGRVMDNLNETIQDIRRYIFDLRSDMPDDDLQSGIERLLRDFHINTLLETDLEVSGTPVEIMSMERRRHIFQIVREALANTAKHARARWVKIDLQYNKNALDMTIFDDGIGMETLQVSKGYGLRNIRERVRLLGGTLRIESAPDKGVILHLTVPY